MARAVAIVSRGGNLGPLSWPGRFLLETRLVIGFTPRAVSAGRTRVATSRPLREPARLRRFQPGTRTVSQYPTRPRGLTKSGSPKSPARGTDTSAGSNFSVSTQSKALRGEATRGPAAYGVRAPSRPRAPCNTRSSQTPPRPSREPAHPGPRRTGAQEDAAYGKQTCWGLRIHIRPSRGRDVFRTARCALPTPPSAGLFTSTRYVRGAIDNDCRVGCPLFCFVAESGWLPHLAGWTCRSRGGRFSPARG